MKRSSCAPAGNLAAQPSSFCIVVLQNPKGSWQAAEACFSATLAFLQPAPHAWDFPKKASLSHVLAVAHLGHLRPTCRFCFAASQPAKKKLQRQGHGRYYLRDFWATVKESSPKLRDDNAWHHKLNSFDSQLLRSAAGESGFSPATLSESA